MNNQLFTKKTYNLLVIAALFFLLTGFFVICSNRITAQKRNKPITKAALLEAASVNQKLKLGIVEFTRLIEKKGVDFRLTAAVEKELSAAKLHPQIIEAVRNNYRGTAATTTATGNLPRNTSSSMRNTVSVSNNRTSNSRSVANSASSSEAGENAADDTEERYDALYTQALNASYQLVNSGMSQQQAYSVVENVKKFANSAIRLDPDRPEGYKVLAFTAFLTQNYPDAEKYCQDVIDRDGSVQFNVLHYHGNTPVSEVLYISNESVSVEAANGQFNVFKYSEILSVQTKGTFNTGQGTAAVFSMNVSKEGNTYETFFIPSFRGSIQDAQLITRIIARNMRNKR